MTWLHFVFVQSVFAFVGSTLAVVFFKFDGAALSPAFSKLGGLSVGDEEAVKRLADEGVKFLKGAGA
jgi:hypothetical protein